MNHPPNLLFPKNTTIFKNIVFSCFRFHNITMDCTREAFFWIFGNFFPKIRLQKTRN